MPPHELFYRVNLPITEPIIVATESIKLRWLQEKFAELFDQAGEAIIRAGLDFDEVQVERFLVCQGKSGTPQSVEAYPLSSRERLIENIRQALGNEDNIGVAKIVELRVDVILEHGLSQSKHCFPG